MSATTPSYTHPFAWVRLHWFGGGHEQQAKQTRRDEESQAIQQAFQRAYRRFAGVHPTWVSWGFDDTFLRRTLLTGQMAAVAQWQRTDGFVFKGPSAQSLALAWDDQFGALAADDAVRARRMAEAILIAIRFLSLLETECG